MRTTMVQNIYKEEEKIEEKFTEAQIIINKINDWLSTYQPMITAGLAAATLYALWKLDDANDPKSEVTPEEATRLKQRVDKLSTYTTIAGSIMAGIVSLQTIRAKKLAEKMQDRDAKTLAGYYNLERRKIL